ncbi:tRNA (adenosine(37)-N6)-threonylcarbamoyltransferase complex dimerization subunit type 1 TsaB [Lentibacillus sediminis]|uniref:tRNA (adenosine(37)-N6)-threonylcarbamoyltransferase complex dimerization subunit type 1 TsaB n=1 Tax=Lentibacillus sediminis TaxID=1940529 RepID=UPI000C1C4C27|nr:tRNA (adenosine(37)-N6)-threonylcarbamoyltransferase complex dimerization subunit type 1 TsaB [Lentibacillus sediminis]
MNILAIDTSNQALGVAVMKNGEIAGDLTTNLKKNHSVRLMPAIDQLMREVSLTPEELDRIVVAKGPGSYTGVRIGLSTAKTMAWALNIPVVGVSSLEVLGFQGRFFHALVCPFFDARRGLVYGGVYEWKKGRLHSVYSEKNMPMEDLLSLLAEENSEVLFLSPDISLHQESIAEKLRERAVVPEAPYHLPKASHLALAGSMVEPVPTHTLTPNYLRMAEAEAKWLERHKGKSHG